MVKKRSEAEVVFKATDDGLKDTVKGITSELTKKPCRIQVGTSPATINWF